MKNNFKKKFKAFCQNTNKFHFVEFYEHIFL